MQCERFGKRKIFLNEKDYLNKRGAEGRGAIVARRKGCLQKMLKSAKDKKREGDCMKERHSTGFGKQ